MDWVATGLGWAGTLIIAQFPKCWQPWGWLIWVVSAVLWIYVGVDSNILGLVVCNAGYLLLEISGFFKAARKSKWF